MSAAESTEVASPAHCQADPADTCLLGQTELLLPVQTASCESALSIYIYIWLPATGDHVLELLSMVLYKCQNGWLIVYLQYSTSKSILHHKLLQLTDL
eukprot:522426-Amphidinium_carterae.1